METIELRVRVRLFLLGVSPGLTPAQIAFVYGYCTALRSFTHKTILEGLAALKSPLEIKIDE